MKKLQKLSLADLSSEFESQVLSAAEQECVVGGGTGTSYDPYSLSEFENMCDNYTWHGGYYLDSWGEIAYAGAQVLAFGYTGNTEISSMQVTACDLLDACDKDSDKWKQIDDFWKNALSSLGGSVPVVGDLVEAGVDAAWNSLEYDELKKQAPDMLLHMANVALHSNKTCQNDLIFSVDQSGVSTNYYLKDPVTDQVISHYRSTFGFYECLK